MITSASGEAAAASSPHMSRSHLTSDGSTSSTCPPRYFSAKMALHPSCISHLPLSATHILLDLLPPHPTSDALPTSEQRGFIEHRGPRRVLCGSWAQECLRIGAVADTGFWDLDGWELRRGEGGSSSSGSLAEGVDVGQIETGEFGADVEGIVEDPDQLESPAMRRDRSGGEYRAEVTSIPTTAVRANASPARSSGGGAEHGSISLGDTGASGGNQRGTRRTTTPLSTPLPTARGVRNKATQSQPLSTVSPPPTPSATPSATPSESLAFPSPDPPEASPIRRSNRARPQPAVGDEEPAASTSQLAKRTRRSHFSIASTSTSTPTASSSTTRRQHDSDQFPQSVSQSHPQSHSRSHSQSHTQSPQPSRPDSVSPRHTPPETTARRTSCQSGRSRFQWPKLSLRPAEELQAMWDYFLSSAYSQLNLPVPPNTGPGQMDTVQRGMVDRVHGMWVEARSKYMRRNLDHMSIMVSTWTTAREFNLSARALRRYYDANKHRIIDDKGPYVPSDRRPSDWPFHDHEPENIEAKAWWIYDWGTKKCAQFLGLEGDDEVANERRRVGSVAEADALEMDHEDTLESDEDDDESFGAVVAAETEAEMEALVGRVLEGPEGSVARDLDPATHSDKRQTRKRKRAVSRVRSRARRQIISKVKLEEDVDSLEGYDSD